MSREFKIVMATQVIYALQALLLFGAFLDYPLINAQPGFTSLVCGGASNYTAANNISWTTDDAYAPPSKPFNIPTNPGSLQTLRSFPTDPRSPHGRSCYSFLIPSGLNLVRATFTYRNYDTLNQPPVFAISIGATKSSIVNLTSQDPWVEEIILNATETQAFCLIAVSGAPVISLLELRPLPLGAYSHTSPSLGVMLRKLYRINCGSRPHNTTRYPQDIYDRIWDPDQYYLDAVSTSTQSIRLNLITSAVPDDAPMTVLQSDRFNFYNQSLAYSFPLSQSTGNYLMNAYFGTLLNTTGPTIKVLINGGFLVEILGSPPYSSFERTAVQPATYWWNLTLSPISGAPQINGLELYEIVQLQSTTLQKDVGTLNLIGLNYNSQSLQLDWVNGSDPCFPVPWKGVSCSSTGAVIALDLSNLNITGEFLGLFGDLTNLQSLNLSSNHLVGDIPDFSGGFPNLKTLDLSNNDLKGVLDKLATLTLQYLDVMNNQFSGPIPGGLNRSGLVLNTSGNRCIQYTIDTCPAPSVVAPTPSPLSNVNQQHSHSSLPAILGGAVGGVVAALAMLAVIYLCIRSYRHKHEIMAASKEAANIKTVDNLRQVSNAKRFSLKELDTATNHFREVLGVGSFGSVYRGRLADGSHVAIKMRSDASQLGADSFANEVLLLSTVHHQNLVLLKGYCQESKKQLLVYEFMSGGTLMEHLYGSFAKLHPMSWKQRLSIAIGAATGLEYLHYGTTPKIIHRDVKSSNILIGPNNVAKVSDFGLSRLVADADKTHVTTVVKGTAGYLDPEYFTTQKLTDKSDVFSFGVVLMEMLCGREPLSSNYTPDAYNLVAWVRPFLEDSIPKGDYSVLDKSLEDQFKPKSMATVAKLTLRSTERDGANRPTMIEVVKELKRALAIEEEISNNFPVSSPQPGLRTMIKSTSRGKGLYDTENISPRTFHENVFHPR